MPSLVDTHIHLDFFADPPAIAAAARLVEVEDLIVPGVSAQNWQKLLNLAETVPGAWAAPGLHPQEARPWTEDLQAQFDKVLHHPRVIALGEIGLDKQVQTDMDVQEEAFRRMLGLAVTHELPVLLHVRQATGRVLQILKEEKADRVGGVWHAFSGSTETAGRLFDLGFAIGVGGIVTFPEAQRLPDVVRQAPHDLLVLETDAPDLTPHPHRGERNCPAYLPLVARRVAQLKDWTLEETAEVTSRNARRIFGLS